MATRVVDENEIILNGVYYRVSNPVRRFITSQFPGKITLGDYNLESNPITSTFVSSDHRGGIGIERMDPSKDLDRVWWSTGQLRHKDHFVLPKLAVASGSDPDTTLEQFLTFKGVLYAAGGGFLHTYNTNDTWTTLTVSTTMPMNNSTDAGVGMVNDVPTAVFANEEGVYFSTTGESWSVNSTQSTPFIAFFKDQIYAIDSGGQLRRSSDLSGSWTNDAKLKLDDDAVVGLIVARNASQDRVLYAVTQQGLYVHDDANTRFVETDFKVPKNPRNGVGTATWRGSIYYPSKMGLYKINVGRDATVVTTVGLDKDDGVPQVYRGEIVKVIPTLNELLLVVNAQEADTTPATTKIHATAGSRSRMNTHIGGGLTGFSYVAAFDDRGYEIKHITGSSSAGITGAFVGTDQDQYRLWVNYDNNAYYVNLSTDVINPSQIADQTYAASAELETPYFDANVIGQDKVALALRVETENPTANETVTVSYATNYNDSFTALSPITSTGETEFKLPSSANPVGIEFRSIKFKVALARGSTNTNSPDMIKLALLFKKTLPVQFGFDVVLDLTNDHKGKTIRDMQAAVDTAIANKTLMELTYRDDSGGTRNYYVTVLSAQALEETGLNERARFRLTLSEAV